MVNGRPESKLYGTPLSTKEKTKSRSILTDTKRRRKSNSYGLTVVSTYEDDSCHGPFLTTFRRTLNSRKVGSKD